MASAQYETRTRTVEETVVVLTLTEDEADELRAVVGMADSSLVLGRVFRALGKPSAPEAEAPADTFEYDGVMYDLTKTYMDRDDDDWNFSPDFRGADDTPLGRFRHRTDYEGDGYTLANVIAKFGPLTKVTA